MPAPLALTLGDPAGCGPSITAQAWTRRRRDSIPVFYWIGRPEILPDTLPRQEITHPAEAADVFADALPVYPLEKGFDVRPVPGNPNPQHAKAIIDSIQTATRQALLHEASGIVTNPIAKSLLYKAGFTYPGHTEYLASLCRTSRPTQTQPPVMMLVGGGLRVALMTIHIPYKDVPGALTKEHIRTTCRTVHAGLCARFSIPSPRIALAGLNPHAGEEGTIGREEAERINPVAQALRADGLSITDARPGDTVFFEALSGHYDAVIAMNHDQGLIPVKTLDFWGGVNTTLGLPIIRTSPDHGTAYDAAARGTCRPDSLIAALKLAAYMATHNHDANV